MTRAGRKRKRGLRERNGRVQRVREDVFATVRAQPHRRKYGEAFRDQKAECELGRLFLDSVITQEQYHAGAEYRRVVADMRRAIMAPKPDASSIDVVAGIAGKAGADLNDKGDNAARARYADAYSALGDAGRAALIAVADIAVWDKPREIMRGTTADLRAGLNVLAAHFGFVRKAYARAW